MGHQKIGSTRVCKVSMRKGVGDLYSPAGSIPPQPERPSMLHRPAPVLACCYHQIGLQRQVHRLGIAKIHCLSTLVLLEASSVSLAHFISTSRRSSGLLYSMVMSLFAFLLPAASRSPMASTLRDMRFLLRPMRSSVCSQCRRGFSNTPMPQAGHNKWSKIKHTKGRKDARITSERTTHVQAIKLYSQCWCLPLLSSWSSHQRAYTRATQYTDPTRISTHTSPTQ